jgi:hypothetical protein
MEFEKLHIAMMTVLSLDYESAFPEEYFSTLAPVGYDCATRSHQVSMSSGSWSR